MPTSKAWWKRLVRPLLPTDLRWFKPWEAAPMAQPSSPPYSTLPASGLRENSPLWPFQKRMETQFLPKTLAQPSPMRADMEWLPSSELSRLMTMGILLQDGILTREQVEQILRESPRAAEVIPPPLPTEPPKPSKESRIASMVQKTKQTSKIEFLRLVHAKLKAPPPPPTTPRVLGMDSLPLEAKPPRVEGETLDQVERSMPQRRERTLSEKMYWQNQDELERKKKQVEKLLEDPEILKLQAEVDEMRLKQAPRAQIRRLEKEIWKIKNRAIPEETQPQKGPEPEEKELWKILRGMFLVIPVPEAKARWVNDEEVPLETMMETRQYDLAFLAERLLSPRDRRGIVVVHKMSQEEGNEKEFLEELSKQLAKGAREKPQNL